MMSAYIMTNYDLIWFSAILCQTFTFILVLTFFFKSHTGDEVKSYIFGLLMDLCSIIFFFSNSVYFFMFNNYLMLFLNVIMFIFSMYVFIKQLKKAYP